MSLEELVLQAPQQQRAIDELIKEGYILQEPTQASILPRRLSESVWGTSIPPGLILPSGVLSGSRFGAKTLGPS